MALSLKFYQDAQPHTCSYLSDQKAQNLYPDPSLPMTNEIYSELIQYGFRRSGNSSYRPHCPACQACVPVRINIKQFVLSRSQRRCLKRNQQLTISHHPAEFNPEHFSLYNRYLNARHAGGGMENPSEESYRNFLLSYWSHTRFIEFRDGPKLIGLAVTDTVDNALSAFYTFFDPDYAQQSIGTYAILEQINLAKARDFSTLYLGYWIEDCQKMRYKQNFSGLEGYINHQWQALET
jgi:arginine-tRNA-protein transferase